MCKKIVKWFLPPPFDPLTREITGFDPFGFDREEPREEPVEDRPPTLRGGGTVTVAQPQQQPPQQKPKEEDEFQRQRAGAGGSEDRTRGLLRSRSRRGLVT